MEFAEPVFEVFLHYASRGTVTVEAFDSAGVSFATVSGPATNPTGPFDVWQPLSIRVAENTIAFVRVHGLGGGRTAVDDVGYRRIINSAPVAHCQNVARFAGPTCSAEADINDGSYDLDIGDAITLSQSPAGPYPLGNTAVTLTVTDSRGASCQCTATVTVANPDPVVTLTGPTDGAIYAVSAPVSFTGDFTDAGGGTHTGTWWFDDLTQAATIVEPAGTTLGSASATHTFAVAGVYSVKLTVTDACGGAATADQMNGLEVLVVVFDPEGGFVTGGGWIHSPAGAYTVDPSVIGKANFGFVAKYQTGANLPTGHTEFQFKAGDLNFKSSSYDWLVVAGSKAKFKGRGTINGSGDFIFQLTATDGQANGGGGSDKFRIRIWDPTGGGVIYDNQPGNPDDADATTSLGGGGIVIHNP